MNEFKRDGKGDENNNHPFENFHAPVGRLTGDLFIDAFEGLQFS
jgi:hypothetical protein